MKYTNGQMNILMMLSNMKRFLLFLFLGFGIISAFPLRDRPDTLSDDKKEILKNGGAEMEELIDEMSISELYEIVYWYRRYHKAYDLAVSRFAEIPNHADFVEKQLDKFKGVEMSARERKHIIEVLGRVRSPECYQLFYKLLDDKTSADDMEAIKSIPEPETQSQMFELAMPNSLLAARRLMQMHLSEGVEFVKEFDGRMSEGWKVYLSTYRHPDTGELVIPPEHEEPVVRKDKAESVENTQDSNENTPASGTGMIWWLVLVIVFGVGVAVFYKVRSS